MDRERFDFVRAECQDGRDAFVVHPSSHEECLVVGCQKDHLMVQTNRGENRSWDYRKCEEISRSKEEWPRR